ncbi:transposase, IS4 family [Abditibacterium utsteinense]|uniref:Transposase, IS4 family n=1 Tax=Abditibacterium utsteinense TaxID=1960156 RepID=A0A2S8SPK3_9BACT|nr:transposase, IS4 family [Abditibacterium utsteinense]
MIDALLHHFSALEDPRCAGKVEHQLLDIVVIAVCAVIACAESFEDMALYGRSKLSWLQQFLALPNGIPSHDTFRRVLLLLQPHAFEACFAAWAHALTEPLPREVIAIDGKTLRGSFDTRQSRGPLHLVSAWACEQGLSLGQQCVAEKSNEITAIPLLLESLHLENTLVTLDAMGCQTKIARQILDQKANYLLVLKANHRHDYSAVKAHFLEGSSPYPTGHLISDGFDDSHGRLVRRRVFASQDPVLLAKLDSWPGLNTVLALESIRSVKRQSVNGHAKVETQIRYFLCSANDDPALLAQAIRRHWAIENNLHWVLDVTFHEDDSRIREHNAVINWAVLRKIALNLLGKDTAKISLKAKRKKAAWNNDYMAQLLQINLMR